MDTGCSRALHAHSFSYYASQRLHPVKKRHRSVLCAADKEARNRAVTPPWAGNPRTPETGGANAAVDGADNGSASNGASASRSYRVDSSYAALQQGSWDNTQRNGDSPDGSAASREGNGAAPRSGNGAAPRPRSNIGPPKVVAAGQGRNSPAPRMVRQDPMPADPDPPPNMFSELVTWFGKRGKYETKPDGTLKYPDLGPVPEFDQYGRLVVTPPKVMTDWASDMEVGDDWAYRPGFGNPPPPARDTRLRYPNTNTPRDSYMKPMADPVGAVDRLSWDRRSRERRLAEEATLNRRETRAAFTFAGIWLVLLPLALGFLISRGIADPFMSFIQETNPEKFALSARMKREGTNELKMEAVKLRFEAQIGKAPPLSDAATFRHLQHEAIEYQKEKRHEMQVGYVNLINDLTVLITFGIVLATRDQGRILLRNVTGRLSQALSQTGKAFILILVADIIMGYHSEEGWTATMELLSEHYALEVPHDIIDAFVAVVPVGLDTAFKYWLFKGLNRIDPAAAIIIDEIDRH